MNLEEYVRQQGDVDQHAYRSHGASMGGVSSMMLLSGKDMWLQPMCRRKEAQAHCIVGLIQKCFNTLRTGSFKLFKRPFPGFLTILTL